MLVLLLVWGCPMFNIISRSCSFLLMLNCARAHDYKLPPVFERQLASKQAALGKAQLSSQSVCAIPTP